MDKWDNHDSNTDMLPTSISEINVVLHVRLLQAFIVKTF
jgi:hypothetical protein